MESKFIRVTDDVIINVSWIAKIIRQPVRSPEYDEWNNEYIKLMKDVVTTYITRNPGILNDAQKTEEEISNELYSKFAPIVKKNLENSKGVAPEAFVHCYILYLFNGDEIPITEDIFQQLTKIIKVDMDGEIDNYFMSEKFLDE